MCVTGCVLAPLKVHSVLTALAPELHNAGGLYIEGFAIGSPSQAARDKKAAAKLWVLSEDLAGMRESTT